MGELEPLIATAIALFVGLMMTRLFKWWHWHFPDVTAYLIAGLIIGPYGIGRFGLPGIGFATFRQVESMNLLNNAALGFIAFAIGSEFKWSDLQKIGRQAATIGVIQSVAATLTVDLALLLLHGLLGPALPVPVCITLGAIAAATAPAATLMVVRQYKANGPITRLLLPIVALDDAVGLVVFAVSFGMAQALQGSTFNGITIGLNPFLEIAASVAFGGLMGWLLTKIEKCFYSNTNRLAITISFVFLTISLSSLDFKRGDLLLSFSPLLVCMMMGTVFCNTCKYASDIFARADRWTAPLYTVFFVLSGAALEIGVFQRPVIVLIGAVYVLSRAAGKYLGSTATAAALRCGGTIRRYLGITLFPQAGVALGMILTASRLGHFEGDLIKNVVLFGVLIYEIVGPSLTKWALTRAGEILPPAASGQNRERFRPKP
jgi:Kef-type K+ transport system membrane component KefB